MNRLRGLLDWRFALSLALLMLVFYLVWAGLATQADNEAKSERIDALIVALDEQADRADEDRAAAAVERDALLANQDALLAYTERLAARQTALLAWLQEHGIEIPTRYVRVPKAPAAASPTPSSARRPAQPRTTPRATAPADRPGRSENAPGRKRPNLRGKR